MKHFNVLRKSSNYLLGSAILFFTAGCEKEDIPVLDNNTNDPVVMSQEITQSLTEKGNLTSFVEAFENLEMSSEDVAEGITIFAPVDDALQGNSYINAGQARVAIDTTTSALTPDVLKDHIVKGIIETTKLVDGDKLTTLSGKQLQVVIDGDNISINGVLVSGKNVATNKKYVVHTVDQIIKSVEQKSTTGSIAVTVWNGAKWSTDKPKGETQAGVTVNLYKSKEDYAQGIVAYTQETDIDGVAVFNEVEIIYTESGDIHGYHIEAKKGDMSSIFYQSEHTVNGVYMGLFPVGIFQTQAEVDASASQKYAAPGNFQWMDVNGDAVIDDIDKLALPKNYLKTDGSKTALVEITIGYEDNQGMSPIQSGEAALKILADSYQNLDTWHKTLAIADGMLSNDAECGNMMNWCEVDNFAFNASNTTFTSIWQAGYHNIGQLNKILRDVPALSFIEKEEVLAQAKGLRAYIYLQMLSYFGNIPLQTSVEMDGSITQSHSEEVYNFIIMDLESAKTTLPLKWASDKNHQITADAAKTLIAKAALWKKDFQKVDIYATEILHNGSYQLSENDTVLFADRTNAEVIWDFSLNANPEFTSYFYGRSFAPAVRLSEVYLMKAEAQIMLGNTTTGIDYLNVIRGRLGMSPTNSTQDLYPTWKSAMSREGSRFVNLLRWGTAMDVLAAKGFGPQHLLLPIPQIIIDSYPNLTQNPGY